MSPMVMVTVMVATGKDDDECMNLVDVPDDDSTMMCKLNSKLIFAVLSH
jgi:hypothetical protein